MIRDGILHLQIWRSAEEPISTAASTTRNDNSKFRTLRAWKVSHTGGMCSKARNILEALSSSSSPNRFSLGTSHPSRLLPIHLGSCPRGEAHLHDGNTRMALQVSGQVCRQKDCGKWQERENKKWTELQHLEEISLQGVSQELVLARPGDAVKLLVASRLVTSAWAITT